MEPLVLPAWLALTLAALAALRVWRLLATDDAGEPIRLLKDKTLRRMAGPLDRPYPGRILRTRLRVAASLDEGYGCPYCFGFWLALGAVASALAWSDTWPWQLVCGTLSASWIIGHLGAQLDKET
jgi:hypothetical protein